MAAMAADLPDELWRRILEIGIQRSNLTFKDICSVSLSCKRFHRLSDESSLWSTLLSSDFPRNDAVSSSSSLPSKLIYKFRRAMITWHPDVELVLTWHADLKVWRLKTNSGV